jgi:predicted nuclease of predicted toxin-antitoxin system
MSLKFLADQCVPGSIIGALRADGYEVLRLRDVIPPDSPDLAVISKAQELGAILLSLNGDFADIVSYPPANYKGIIGLQVRNHPEIIPQIITRLSAFLSEHADITYYGGKLLVVEAHRIRIRGSV